MQQDCEANAISHFVLVDGVRIHYRLFNPNDLDKPNLLFVHGMWAHSHWWDHIAPQFTTRFRVAAIDLAGMGDSQPRTVYTMHGFAQDVLAVAEDSGMTELTIVAHSFGGNVAAHACHLQSEKISRIVLIDTHLYIPGEVMPSPDALAQARVKNRTYVDAEEALSRYRLMPIGGNVEPHLLRHIARSGLRRDADGWRWKFDTTIHPLLWNDAGRGVPAHISNPVDIIYGELSSVVPTEAVHAGYRFFDNCGIPVMIHGSNHHILLEKPSELIAALYGLFARNPDQNAVG